MLPPDPVRSATMRAVKSRDTGPERAVRRLLHGLGYRFRLHDASLPGTPDIVFAARRKVVLVHGCFWHGHDCPRGARTPRRNADYWRAKIARNVARDAAADARLTTLGWGAFVVWECALKRAPTHDLAALKADLRGFLGATAAAEPNRRPPR